MKSSRIGWIPPQMGDFLQCHDWDWSWGTLQCNSLMLYFTAETLGLINVHKGGLKLMWSYLRHCVEIIQKKGEKEDVMFKEGLKNSKEILFWIYLL